MSSIPPQSSDAESTAFPSRAVDPNATAAPRPEAEVEARPTVTFDADTRPNPQDPAPRQAPTRFRAGDLVPGTRYRIRRWVGWGGMGSVFEAINEDTERRVALKILHEQFVTRAEVARGFQIEARVTGRLEAQDIRADNIVEVYDFKGLPDGRAVIAMEFLDGRDLYEETRSGPLAMSRVIAIGRQIARGLGAAHRAGIIHRDLKPANVMLVRRQGRPDFVKVLDFGVARLLADESTSRGGGTPMYLAPEGLLHGGDHTIDIYALGCVLFELATGQPPYEGSREELAIQHRDAPVPVPSVVSRQPIPASFDDLVARCMAKKPADRIASMTELEARLCEIQIERKWVTPWDDLSPPDVEPARRAFIAQALATKSGTPRSIRGPMLTAVLGLAVAIGVITWASLPDRTSVGAHTVSRVDELRQAAKAAAARAYFVYPPVDDPHGSTAFREVLALENLDTRDAKAKGSELRSEFADTLTRLGDRYWQYEEARTFSHEYYAMAALFVPSGRALERAGVTPTALDRLRLKASKGDFTAYELASVVPLAALAEEDLVKRGEMLRDARRWSTSPRAEAQLERLIEVVAPPPPSPPPAAVKSSPSTTTGTPPAESSGSATAAAEDPPSENSEVVTPLPDSAPPLAAEFQIEAWMKEAKRAQAAGRFRDAEDLYHRVLAERPRHIGALDGLGDALFAAAQYAESLRYRKLAVGVRPRSARHHLALGDAFFKTSVFDKARAAYLRAEELGSTEAQARIQKVASKLQP